MLDKNILAFLLSKLITKKTVALGFVLGIFVIPSMGQPAQETISGTVTEASTGETLAGVNIQVKGTTTGTSTNAQGKYELQVRSLQDTLVFSFLGYHTEEVSINGRTEIDINMQSQAISGEELVVIGYGKQKKSDLTGSISHLEGQTFENQSTTQITDMLAGTIAGVNMTQSTSAAGGGGLKLEALPH